MMNQLLTIFGSSSKLECDLCCRNSEQNDHCYQAKFVDMHLRNAEIVAGVFYSQFPVTTMSKQTTPIKINL